MLALVNSRLRSDSVCLQYLVVYICMAISDPQANQLHVVVMFRGQSAKLFCSLTPYCLKEMGPEGYLW